jgi:hypothetical protein
MSTAVDIAIDYDAGFMVLLSPGNPQDESAP